MNVDITYFKKQIGEKLKAKAWTTTLVSADWKKVSRKLACLNDYYIVAGGNTFEEAISQLTYLVVANLALNDEYKQSAFEGIHKPPQNVVDIPSELDFEVDPFTGVTITESEK